MNTIISIIKTSMVIVLGMMIFADISNAQTTDNDKGHRIVFQLTTDDPRSHKALINQLKNLTKGWPEAEFQVVVHSAGIGFLVKDKTAYAAEIASLTAKGVIFVACENTLTAKGITKEEILDEAIFVPMGIAEIVLKQEAGWSYIKAGL